MNHKQGVWQASSDKLTWAGLDMLPVSSGAAAAAAAGAPPEANATLDAYRELATAGGGCEAALRACPARLSTMGRGLDEDLAYFLAAAAAGRHAGRLLREVPSPA